MAGVRAIAQRGDPTGRCLTDTTENGPQRNRRGPSPVLTNVILEEGYEFGTTPLNIGASIVCVPSCLFPARANGA